MFDDLPNGNSPLPDGAPSNRAGEGPFPPQATQNPSIPASGPIQPRSPFRPQPSGVEDMFQDSDRIEKPTVFQPRATAAPLDQFGVAGQVPLDPYTGESLKAKNKTIVLILMLFSLLLVLVAGWYAYKMFFSAVVPDISQEIAPADQETEAASSDLIPVAEQDEAGEKQTDNLWGTDEPVEENKVVEPEKSVDTDGDGLTDSEEFQLGTNSKEADTDSDGLFDREELKFYKSDPLDSDTDKDGYADGMEVKGGYDPNGPGKLLDQTNSLQAD